MCRVDKNRCAWLGSIFRHRHHLSSLNENVTLCQNIGLSSNVESSLSHTLFKCHSARSFQEKIGQVSSVSVLAFHAVANVQTRGDQTQAAIRFRLNVLWLHESRQMEWSALRTFDIGC